MCEFREPLSLVEGLFRQADLVGRTAAEIRRLEARYRVTLPTTYRRFLEVMGRKSGRLVGHDYLDIQFDYVLRATAELPALLRELDEEAGAFALPADALIVLGRDQEQFHFIRCDRADDSAVWYFNLDDLKPRQVRRSVGGWLRGWCEEAEQAIADGWYDRDRGRK